jgi:hypothetical protein
MGAGDGHATRIQRISASEFGLTSTFTFRIGDDAYTSKLTGCLKDAEAHDGIGLTGLPRLRQPEHSRLGLFWLSCTRRRRGVRRLLWIPEREESGMPSLVCTGATLQCSYGAVPATFAASGTQTSAGSPVGVVTDVEVANVLSFGICSSPANPAKSPVNPPPCTPLLVPWSPGSAQVTIDEVSALDDSSQCTCVYLGVVMVSTAGQTAVSDQ